jgi:nicotinamidase/pyrazinamidase
MTASADGGALIVVDLQVDFLPGGALAVAGGDEILDPIARLVDSGRHAVVIATQDWHPPGHASFASSHPGRQPFVEIELHGRPQVLWPDHCVQGSGGAELHPSLPRPPLTAIVRKGTDPQVDSYSAFRNNWDAQGTRRPTGLAGMLRELAVDAVDLVGLARDVCVRWSAEDAAAAGFETTVLWELTRPVDPGSDAAVRTAMIERGVRVV